MNLKARIAKLEQTAGDNAPFEPAHIVYIQGGVDSEAYKEALPDIEARETRGQTVIVFTIRDCSIKEPDIEQC